MSNSCLQKLVSRPAERRAIGFGIVKVVHTAWGFQSAGISVSCLELCLLSPGPCAIQAFAPEDATLKLCS